jgi:hypothetical protein
VRLGELWGARNQSPETWAERFRPVVDGLLAEGHTPLGLDALIKDIQSQNSTKGEDPIFRVQMEEYLMERALEGLPVASDSEQDVLSRYAYATSAVIRLQNNKGALTDAQAVDKIEALAEGLYRRYPSLRQTVDDSIGSSYYSSNIFSLLGRYLTIRFGVGGAEVNEGYLQCMQDNALELAGRLAKGRRGGLNVVRFAGLAEEFKISSWLGSKSAQGIAPEKLHRLILGHRSIDISNIRHAVSGRPSISDPMKRYHRDIAEWRLQNPNSRYNGEVRHWRSDLLPEDGELWDTVFEGTDAFNAGDEGRWLSEKDPKGYGCRAWWLGAIGNATPGAEDYRKLLYRILRASIKQGELVELSPLKM